MKKIILSTFLAGMVSLFAAAQTKEPAKPVHAVHKVQPTSKAPVTKVKTKPQTTVPQKVNNVVRPKHKKYKGLKTKTKTSQ